MTGRAARNSASLLTAPGRPGESRWWGPCARPFNPPMTRIRGARGRSGRELSIIATALTINRSLLDGGLLCVFQPRGNAPFSQPSESGGELANRSVTSRRVEGEAPVDDVPNRSLHTRFHAGPLIDEDVRRDFVRGRPREGTAPGDHLKDQNAERPDIRTHRDR